MRLTADNIKIDNDEGRFILIISTEEIGNLTVEFHSIALEFEDEVRRELRPYALEAWHAKRDVALGVPQYVTTPIVSVEDAIEAGYALDDPKSPGYYDRMVD